MGEKEIRQRLREIARVLKEFKDSVEAGNPGRGVMPADFVADGPPDREPEMPCSADLSTAGCWGVCPYCHRTDGYINFGCYHWFVCDAHRVKWCVGENLFRTW